MSANLEDVDSPALDDGDVWEDCVISGEPESQSAAHVQVLGSEFRNTRLTGIDLPELTLRDCRLHGSEMSGALFENASLIRVEFVDCRVSGAVLASARLRDVRFTNCRLDEALFRMASLERVEFDRCHLVGGDFYDTELKHVSFLDCDLNGVDYSQARMDQTRFHGSDLLNIRGGTALRGSIIESSQIMAMAFGVFEALGITVDDKRS